METYSYSKLETFHQCKFQYYCTYVLGVKSPDNIYSLMGTTTHDIFESLQERKITKGEALEKFENDLEINKLLNFKFPNEKVETNYVNSIINAIKSFEPIHTIDKVEVEKEVNFEINGHKMRGYIDLITYNIDGTVNVYDFKTSSKYSKSDLPKKARQLILYGIALEQLGYKVNMLAWDMLKYATVAGSRKPKTELRANLTLEPNEPCFVTYPFNETTRQETIEWVTNTIEEIESMDDLFAEWKQDCESDFFCTTLCGNDRCPRLQRLKNNYFNKH